MLSVPTVVMPVGKGKSVGSKLMCGMMSIALLVVISCQSPTSNNPAPPSGVAAPTGLVAVSGDSQATISWSASSGASSYNLYWSTSSGVTTTSGTKIPGATSPYVQTALTNGKSYYYVLTSVTSTGESPASAQAVVVPTTPNLSINEIGNAYYINDSSSIELYNASSVAVNLANYKLKTGSRLNDSTAASPTYADSGTRTFSLPSLTVASHGYIVIRGKVDVDQESGGQTVFLDDGASHYPWLSCSGGFVELENSSGATLDFVGYGSNSVVPSSSSFTYTGTAPAFPSGATAIGYSLARSLSGANTRSGADWTVHAWTTLGGPNDVTTDNASDGDGIPDSSKAANGTLAGLPLHSWGAASGQKDIFMHISYMVNGSVSATDPGIIPKKAALDKVVAAFAAQGYHLHIDAGTLFSSTPGDTANYDLDGTDHSVPYVGSASLGKQAGYASATQYKTAYMSAAKKQVFFYILFADSQLSPAASGSSGIAELPGSTAIISLGHWGLTTTATTGYTAQQNTNELVNYQAATLMHEFGHNLGLQHGGDEGVNFKPNYFSIMNYLYQLQGLPTSGATAADRYYSQYWSANGAVGYSGQNALSLNSSWESFAYWSSWKVGSVGDSPVDANFKIDYSHGAGLTIDETSVNDTQGVRQPAISTASIAFDATQTALSTNHSLNILDRLNPQTTPLTLRVLHDYNDWGNISSVFQRTDNGYNFGNTVPVARTAASVPSAVMTPREIFNNPHPVSSQPCVNPFLGPPGGPR